MTLSTEMRPEMEALYDDFRVAESSGSPPPWTRFNKLMAKLNNAVGLDVVRDAPEIFTGDFTLKRAQVNPLTLQVVYTEDGRPIADPLPWHEGESLTSIFYERYNLSTGARLSHGWVDTETRRLVQSG